MCGIAGFIGPGAATDVMTAMLRVMAHRGPDGHGNWRDPDAGILLGHLRLAIIDVNSGAQPMLSPDGRYVLVYNGEIYNYIELRPALEQKGWHFATASDTEVLLAGLVLEGPAFLTKTIGMFALALWDRSERRMLLARDRMGIKPLYVAEMPHGLAFASELKSLLLLPGVKRELDPDALEAFFTLRYVPSPLTMVSGIRKFPAAHYAWIAGGSMTLTRWWDVAFASPEGEMTRAQEDELDWHLEDAVRLSLRSDVPYGSFLSGGVDSALVTGLMARQSPQRVRTYSVGFAGVSDEREAAGRIAQAIGTDHTVLELTPEDLRSLPAVVRMLDEPFPDPIVLAMDALAARAVRDVKVILTGEGADELFGGYVHHKHLMLLNAWAKYIPQPLLGFGAAMAANLPQGLLRHLFDYPVPPGREAASRLAGLIRSAGTDADSYLSYVSLFNGAERRRLFSSPAHEAGIELVTRDITRGSAAFIDRLWSSEYRYWLSDNILFKQDKTLMAHSVEGRVPFCDHRLVELAAQLPLRARFGCRGRKSALRDAADRLVPELPKQGAKHAFMIPQDGSYAAVIREMAQDMLSSRRIRQLGVFNGKAIDALLEAFKVPSLLSGKQVLALLMFTLWEREVLAAS